LVAALASWLDARAHHGVWLVRIEDVDRPRCEPGADQRILQQLADCGLLPDEPPTWQSHHAARYELALAQLIERDMAYACDCSRKDIEQAWAARGIVRERHQELVYPGTCRDKPPPFTPVTSGRNFTHSPSTQSLAWRFRIPDNTTVNWQDRRLGHRTQHLNDTVGDFVLRRSDGVWSYQLAVVTDDAHQGITHVVRGEDLADNTPRQIVLQQSLQLPPLQYLHTPLVLNASGEKLSKQQGAQAVDTAEPLIALNAAASALGLSCVQGSVPDALLHWTLEWRSRWAGSLQSESR
jgi:glutamyl-Q tRNA(Asp) synthetase